MTNGILPDTGMLDTGWGVKPSGEGMPPAFGGKLRLGHLPSPQLEQQHYQPIEHPRVPDSLGSGALFMAQPDTFWPGPEEGTDADTGQDPWDADG